MEKKSIAGVVAWACASPALAHAPEMCPAVALDNGFISLGHIGMLLSALIIGVAALFLYFYLELPVRLLKWVLLIVGVLAATFGGTEPLGWPAGFWAFFGSLGIGGFLLWQFTDLSRDYRFSHRLAAGAAALVWGTIAISYAEPVVGFMAVAALGYVIASSQMIDTLASPLEIGDMNYSGSTTFAGFVILMGYLVGMYFKLPVAVFEFGALYVAGLVFSASLLIATWSGFNKTWLAYLWHEAVFLTAALASVLYGGEIGSDGLVQLGGSLIAVWILLKVIDFVSRIFIRSTFLAIMVLLGIGVMGVIMSTSLIEHADFLRTYTFL